MSYIHLIAYRLKALAASPLTLVLMLLVPLAGTLVAGALVHPRHPGLPIALVDLDQSPYSRLIAERLGQRSVLRMRQTDEQTAVRLVETRQVEAALVLVEGLQKRVEAGEPYDVVRLVTSPTSLAGHMAGEYTAGEVIRLASNATAAGLVTAEYVRLKRTPQSDVRPLFDQVWQRADSHWEPEPLMPLEYREYGSPLAQPASVDAGRSLGIYGLVATAVLFNCLLAAGWMVQDRQSGLLSRLLTTRTSPWRYLTADALTLTLIGAVTTAITLAAFTLGLDWPLITHGADALLLGGYLVAATGLAVLAGAMVRTEFQLQTMAPLAALITGLLGGGLGNLAEFSTRFRLLSLFTPQGWLLQGLRSAATGAIPVAAAVLAAAGVLCALTGWWLATRRPAVTT